MSAQQRKIVFFLGAGASFGAGGFATVQGGGHLAIPTQETFWNTFLRFCHSAKNRRDIESFLFRYFLGYARVPARANASTRRSMLQRIDVEEVFTFLSERAAAPSTSPALRAYAKRIWAALVIELAHVFARFEPNKRTRAIYKHFVGNLVRSRDTIVSFNYDLIFENSVPQSFSWHYEEIESVPNSIGVLKPHGSINWEDTEPIEINDNPPRPLVIAPTHLKFVQPNPSSDESAGYLDHAPGVRLVWAAMEREMKDAKALVFIGYSFPVADLYFSSVLRSVLADRDGAPGVAIVNPDAVAISARLRGRFALEKIGVFFDLESFVQSSRKQLLARLA
jgi:hypothetical protein